MGLFNKDNSLNLILLLYFALLPFVFFSTILDPFLLARQLLTTILLFVVFLFLILKKKASEYYRIDTTLLLFIGLIVFCISSFYNSQIVDLSHTALSKYLVFLLFFILIRSLLLNEKLKVTNLYFYIILFGVLSIVIALLAFTNKSIVGQHLLRQVSSISGTFGNKNFLSSILFFCLPFYFIGISLSKKIKAICISAIVFTVMLLLMLRTRTILIALSLYLFLALLLLIKDKLSKRKLGYIILIATSTILIGVFYLFSIKDNLDSSSDIRIQYFHRLLSSNTFYSRIEFWQQAIYVIKGNFFSGIGVGNWITAYPKYGLDHFSNSAIVNGRMIISNPHNDFLMVFSEIGVFGFLCYLGIFISILYQSYWLSVNESNSSDRRNASYFFLFIICYFIIAFFDFPLTRIEHQIVLLTVFALINAKYLKAKSTLEFKVPSRLVYVFSFFLLVYASTIVAFRIVGEKHLNKAIIAEKTFDNTTALFEFNKAKNTFFSTDNYAIPLDWHIGKAQYYSGNYKESLDSFIKAYKINPNSLVVNNDLASNYVKNNYVSKGIKHYKEALTISPNYEDARINLAATYYNTNEYEKAFQTIDKCDSNSKQDSYKQILTPIVEKKLNTTLLKMNNPKLNEQLKSKIKTVDDLLQYYFDYKQKNCTFDEYIQSSVK
jgi:O-antigen ligase